MNAAEGEPLWLRAGGKRLEARQWLPAGARAPSVVLLHEGLGSVSLWRDFPARLAEATGRGVLAYSRAGYGQSDPADLPRPLDYMRREARDVLPDLLAGLSDFVLIGHSDGASIAAIYAGEVADDRLAGLDPRARRRLIELLRERSETMLVSTHDLLMVSELFPRMIIMDEGRIVADGPTETLLADEPLLEAHGLEMPRC